MNRAFNRKRDKTWMHSPEALTKHFISYTVKFLGNAEVEQPKGTEIVKDAVRKLKFARHIKKSEGQKTPKVELQISIYGVKILDSKTKEVLHNCQLHRISFCADDKTDKKIFTFICKDAESNKHMCYVFDSEKCAEEITLTIGQAFDLAYKKFLETGGKDVETRKQIASLQKRIQELETENIELKKKVQEMEINVKVTQGSSSPLHHPHLREESHLNLQAQIYLTWFHFHQHRPFYLHHPVMAQNFLLYLLDLLRPEKIFLVLSHLTLSSRAGETFHRTFNPNWMKCRRGSKWD
ncbi:PTB domain-containing engulfment adapter protein 1 isoform X6 [Scyliorhinus canicula]|uniref:PTB domain-containing engulfment adapter protein 1 isoform X6 n=1 Tax=Scyliorhinus canicula TaxID=7830 RepID=UPI0018F487A3|nr:PTB domain-containing engulfment adapter protein 1 isoform X6 [Scyliorhinus canicula]